MSGTDFTPSQRAAIESRGSAILVAAGAGSGKTRVLTERLIGYLTDKENPRDVDSFLVITFTRAAAAELKGRILEEIARQIAADPGNRHLRRQSALCRRAQIGTIHGFCSELLRQNCQIYDNLFQIKKCEKEIIIQKDYGNIKKKKITIKEEKSFLIKFLKKKLKRLSFICYKYPNLNEQNIKPICLDVFQWIEKSPNKKNIIIKFEKTFIKEFSNIINKLVTDKPFMLFNLEENIDIQEYLCSFKYFKYPQYISYNLSSEKKDPQKNYCKIISYILEKSFYYNELGNKYDKYFPYNLFYKEPRGFLYFNILLTGESRAGKSCFINRLFNKLVCYESSKFESSTLQINSYELYPPEEENPNPNKLKNGFGGIKIFDTPGLVKTKDLDSFELIKEKFGEIFNKIHIIYFFIKSQSNLEQTSRIFSGREWLSAVSIQSS